MDVLEDFTAQHRLIETQLGQCDLLLESPDALLARLREVRPVLLEHLDAKDRFYEQLKELCARNRDLAGGNIAKIFDDNMKVQAGAVRRFFSALDTVSFPLLGQSYKTMSMIIKSRLSTEERAVFPLYRRNLGPT